MAIDPSRTGVIHTASDGRDILLNDPDGWEVDQPWLWHDGPADSEDGTGGPWGNPPPGADAAAPALTGMTLPAVTRCTQLLTEAIAGMPWKVYTGRKQVVTPTWITDPQALARDGRRLTAPGPDARLSGVEFWATIITSMLWWGEGIIYTPRRHDEQGEPTGPIVAPVYALHPGLVDVDDGNYYVRDDDGPQDWHRIDARELIVIRHLVRPGRVRGLGVIQAHAADLGFSANLRGFIDNAYKRGVPNGYLKSDKPDLTAPAARKLKDQWMAAHGGDRKSIAVLNATTSFTALSLDPQAAQYVELLRLSAWQICLMFGVPASKLDIDMGGSMTYTNREQRAQEWVQDSLLGIARRIESAIDSVLTVGTSLKIDFRALLRGDTAARYAAYAVGLSGGWLTLDEVRDAEDLPPLPDTPPEPAPDPAPVSTAPDTEPTEPPPDLSPDLLAIADGPGLAYA